MQASSGKEEMLDAKKYLQLPPEESSIGIVKSMQRERQKWDGISNGGPFTARATAALSGARPRPTPPLACRVTVGHNRSERKAGAFPQQRLLAGEPAEQPLAGTGGCSLTKASSARFQLQDDLAQDHDRKNQKRSRKKQHDDVRHGNPPISLHDSEGTAHVRKR